MYTVSIRLATLATWSRWSGPTKFDNLMTKKNVEQHFQGSKKKPLKLQDGAHFKHKVNDYNLISYTGDSIALLCV